MKTNNVNKCVALIQEHIGNIKPKIAFILGSGLSGIGDHFSDKIEIDYADLPGFPAGGIIGHASKLTIAKFQGLDIACLQGRSHRYEGEQSHSIVKTYIRTLKQLGCDSLIITNAAGSFHQEMPPGSLMLINDHINFQIDNPLTGPNDDEFGPRFPPLDEAYDSELARLMQTAAKQNNIKLHQGVYFCVMGPNYETAAEIRAFKIMGADAVGMSTVPEVIVASHCGFKIAAISVITNFVTGMNSEIHSHTAVVDAANKASHNLEKLLKTFLEQFK